jgi:hypothetical protein
LAEKEFIVAGASGIRAEIEILNPEYTLSEVKLDATTRDTGGVLLFRIDPVPAGLPPFLVRIVHDNHEAVDVDLIGDRVERIAFATQAPRYVGHKTQSPDTDLRPIEIGSIPPS